MGKKILVLDKAAEKQNGLFVHYCQEPDDALAILMGVGPAFGHDKFAQAKKIRPDILIVDESFLSTFEGLDLLEIIRKYYTLRSVAILVASNGEVDPAVISRYRIAGIVSKPYNVEALIEAGTGSALNVKTAGTGTVLAGAFSLSRRGLENLLYKLSSLKTLVPAGAKAVFGTKMAITVAATVITLATVAEADHRPETAPQSTQKIPEFPSTGTHEIGITSQQEESINPAPEMPVAKQKSPPAVSETRIEAIAAATPEARVYRIVAIPDTLTE